MENNKQPVLPLDDITVISLEHAVAAPFCTRQLADLGARVIKIERPGVGDFARNYDERVRGLASHFVWTNRGKESLTLDAKHDKAKPILSALLEKADVLVQNLAPGATARLGLSYEALRERYPKLIVCDISGYGIGGPYEQKKAYDLLIQSESGFLSVTGQAADERGDNMAKAGISLADNSAGTYAFSSILSALRLRDRTGQGSHIDLSMLEATVEWMGYVMHYAFDDAPPPARAGASHATIYPYGPFAAKDGNVMLGLQNEREWQAFCETVLDDASLTIDERFNSNSKRSENRLALNTIIDNTFSQLTRQQVIKKLEAAQIANAQVNEMRDVWAHPQLKARNRWQTINSSAGELPALLPPGESSAYTPVMGDIPDLGEHNQSILQELGYSVTDIEALKQQNVI